MIFYYYVADFIINMYFFITIDIGNESDKAYSKLPVVGPITNGIDAVIASDKIWNKIEESITSS